MDYCFDPETEKSKCCKPGDPDCVNQQTWYKFEGYNVKLLDEEDDQEDVDPEELTQKKMLCASSLKNRISYYA
jgi:hypothetical protein